MILRKDVLLVAVEFVAAAATSIACAGQLTRISEFSAFWAVSMAVAFVLIQVCRFRGEPRSENLHEASLMAAIGPFGVLIAAIHRLPPAYRRRKRDSRLYP